METIKNFSSISIDDKQLVAVCHAEDFAGENALQFDTIIEDFGENIVLNGTKTAVRGAADADFFLVFSSTLVKDRNDLLYKRISAVIVPKDSDGLTIVPISDDTQEIARGQFCRVHFEDVEVQPDLIIGNIGYGKVYVDHLTNVGSVLYASVALSILEKYFSNFVIDSKTESKNGLLWRDHDTARSLAADCQLKLWSLDAMIRQTVVKRNYLFDELESEVGAIKVYSNTIRDMLHRLTSFYDAPVEGVNDDMEHLNAISRTFGTNHTALTAIGYR